ncbi:hypothetical protein [Nocardia shimofusensis]|uniref:hypothetical protein n=1 Tax=Nocardia shimofusensis TaxID=228596 RepID=UPI000A714A8F|nr:hypothetical protein [Nocardia shimofusensis]
MTLPKRTANTKPVFRLPSARPEVLRRVAAALQQPEPESADLSVHRPDIAESRVSA